jgi:pyruvate/2-oxoglutarate dehydrogenase complex dihydrolipoamide dehydrogenase (E3) component
MSDLHPDFSDPASFDFVVIGGGSAGYAAARQAAELGLHVALIEGGREIGGLCILRGCMPSKTVLESANRYLVIQRAREFGLRAEQTGVVASEILARKRRLVGQFADWRREDLERGPFQFIRGRARFIGEHRVEIKPLDDSGPPYEIEGRTFLVATGSQISNVPVPGLDEIGYLTSDDVLELSDYPASVIMLGAGAIGLEATHHLSALGTDVTVVQRCGQILREADEDLANTLEAALARRGVHFHCGSHLLRADRAEDGRKRVWYERHGEEHSAVADDVIAALGRRPFTSPLELHNAGVDLSKIGGVGVDLDQRSNRRHIFAAGDVCGPYEIVHLAVLQAELAARNAARHLGKLAGPPEEMDYRLKLFVLFTEPELAHVGLSEREAAAMGREVRVATHRFDDHGKSIVKGEMHGFVKLITDRATGEIVGGAVVGPSASELIHEVVVAMHFRGKAADLAAVPHYHPTLSEIWTYPAEELSEAWRPTIGAFPRRNAVKTLTAESGAR